MSLDAMIWATKDAPVADVQERAVLAVMSEPARDDGVGSFLAVKTIATRTRLSEREVRACQRAMLERGLLTLGDQSAALQYHRANRTPIVYDLMIPYSMFANIRRINQDRATLGLGPLTPENRPDLPEPPPRKRRADLGKKRPPADRVLGRTASHPMEASETSDSDVGPGVTDSLGGLQAPPGRTTRTSAPYIEPVFEPLLLQTDSTVLPDSAQEEEAPPSDNPALTAAADLLEAVQKTGGLEPDDRLRHGARWADLRTRLAERLEAGWTPEQARRKLSGRLKAGEGELYAMLRWRITQLLAGPPPVSRRPPRAAPAPRRPWCGKCAHPEKRRVIDPGTGGVTAQPCPTCGLAAEVVSA